MKPYYADHAVTIYHADCREWMPDADVVVTDPPYGIGWKHDIVGDDAPFDPAPILALGLPTVLFGGNHFASRLPDSPSWIVWDKHPSGFTGMTQADCEMAWTNLGGPARMFRLHWGRGSTISEGQRRTYHPTQKPLKLMRWVLGLVPDGVVLDPFMGSGTTLVAAKDLGRRSIGVEIEERYCEIAARRCSQEVLGLSA